MAGNVFHRAFALGPLIAWPGSLEASARSIVDGDVRAGDRARVDSVEVVRAVAELLTAAGERLLPGDRILTGAVTQVAVRAGDEVAAEIDGLGRVTLTIAREP